MGQALKTFDAQKGELGTDALTKNGLEEFDGGSDEYRYIEEAVMKLDNGEKLEGLGLEKGDYLDPSIEHVFSLADHVFAVSETCYLFQKLSFYFLVVLFEVALRLKKSNPVRARVMALISACTFQLTECARLAIEKTEESRESAPKRTGGGLARKALRLVKTKFQKKTTVVSMRDHRLTGQKAFTNRASKNTKISLVGDGEEGEVDLVVRFWRRVHAKLGNHQWNAGDVNEKEPLGATQYLVEKMNLFGGHAAGQANNFYHYGTNDASSGRVNEKLKSPFKMKEHAINSVETDRASTRVTEFQANAVEPRITAYSDAIFNLLGEYKAEFFTTGDTSIYPKEYEEVQVIDPIKLEEFLRSRPREFILPQVLAYHISLEGRGVDQTECFNLWLKGETIPEEDHELLTNACEALEDVDTRGNQEDRWCTFELALSKLE